MRNAFGNIYHVKHGLSRTRIYKTWYGMKSRCNNPKMTRYERYGDRGIKVCEEWQNDIRVFYKWAIENGYNDKLTIERIDNDKGYSPENCRWILPSEQTLNTRRTINITHNGKTQCLEWWCKELGIPSNTIFNRVHKQGHTYENALFNYKSYKKNDKKYCKNGHEYTKENTVINSAGYRYCKKCNLLKRERNNQKRREKRKCQTQS